VPRAIGKKLGVASKAIRSAGCRVGTVSRIRSSRVRGVVISQGRKPGARVPRGTVVSLVLSAGQPLRPPFTG
jgi:beta-lactam-binding protein with PASTA domain